MFGDSTYCSIKDFKQLKVVELGWFTLVPYQQEIMNDADVDEPLSQGFYEEQPDEVAPFEFDLTNALPPTIQHLIVNRFPDPALPSLRYLLTAKEQGRFPGLTNITLNAFFRGPGHVSEWEEFEEIAKRTGVILDDGTESDFEDESELEDLEIDRDG